MNNFKSLCLSWAGQLTVIVCAAVIALTFTGYNASASGGWASLTSPTTRGIYGLDCSGSAHCIGVGESGKIIRTTDVSTWVGVSSGTTETLLSVDNYSTTMAIAVGNSGTILRSTDDGATWASITGVTTENISGVSIVSGTVAWIAANDGAVFHTVDGGMTWSAVSDDGSIDANNMDATSSSTAWVVGWNGSAKIGMTSNGGSTWTAQSSGSTGNLYAIDMYSSTVGILGGANAFVAYTTNGGTTWTTTSVSSFSATEAVADIIMTSASNAIIVGNAGHYAFTSDGGVTWTGGVTGASALYDVAAPTSGTYFATGASGSMYVYDVTTPSVPTGLSPATGSYVNDTTPTVSWTASTDSESGIASYDIKVDGGAWSSVTSGTSTTLSALIQGGHTFVVRSVDKAGNASASSSTSIFTVDTTVPTVATPSPTTATAGTSTTFTVTASDASSGISSCTLYVNSASVGGMTYDSTGGIYTKAYTFSSAGTYSSYAVCVDNALNSKTSSTASVSVAAASSGTTTDTTTDTVTSPDAPESAEPATSSESESAVEQADVGDLIKTPCGDDADVNDPCRAVYYYGADHKRHAFTNEKVFFTWYVDFSDLVIVTSSTMASVSLGHNVTYHPGTKMVKFATVNTVYAVDSDGKLRAIDSEATASALYGSDWNTKIDDISDAFFGNYSFGTGITSSADYDPADVLASVSSIDDIL